MKVKQTKVCKECHIPKPLDEFFEQKGSTRSNIKKPHTDGRRRECKECHYKKVRKWVKKNLKKVKKYMREYMKEYMKTYKKK